MKVLEMTTSSGIGGLELYVLRASAALAAMGHAVITAVRPGTMLQQRLEQQGLPWLALPRRSRRLPLVAAYRLARLLEREQVDVIHMHWGHDLFLAALAKRLSRRPVRLVYTRQMALTRRKDDAYHRFLYRQVDLYLTITDKLAEQARAYLPLPAERIRRLYYGVAACPERNAEQCLALRAELKIPDSAFAVVLVGRIEEEKGQHILLEAVRRLHDEGTAVHASIIGPAMDVAYLDGLKQRVLQWGMDDIVHFHGPHPNPSQIMPAFDALVLATRMETFGLVLPEAMRCGVSVVGTDAGGVPEIIEDGRSGLLFAPDDAPALAEALRRLAGDPTLRRNLAQAGRQRADRLFADDVHYQRLWEALSEPLA